MIGDKISNYIIKEFIAEGGMGSVYLCEHETLGRKAAVKILHPEYAANKEVISRFKREAKTLSELKHPNIVEILDFGVQDEKPFLIMEYIEGQPLDEYIAKVTGPIEEKDAITIMTQILKAVQLAHEKGIIHRDLKPSNVIINRKKEIKILDFGIAKKLGSDDYNKTRIGQKLGTLPYMSPEQVKGLSDISYSTDIYSLGVLLYQMVTGKPPYGDNLTEYDISKNVVEFPLPRIKEVYPNAKNYFQAIIDKSTEKHAEKRFVSANEFRETLVVEFDKSCPKQEKLKPSRIGDEKEELTNSEKSNFPYKVIIGLLLFILLFVLLFSFIRYKNLKTNIQLKLAKKTIELNSIKSEKEAINTKYLNKVDESNKLYHDNLSLKSKIKTYKSFFSGDVPLLVDKMKFKSVYSNGATATNYSESLYSYSLFFLNPKIYYTANKSDYVTLYVKIIRPNGTVIKGTNSPYEYSYESVVYVTSGSHSVELTGWGSDEGGVYDNGKYTMEIYYYSSLIGTQVFQVY